MHSARGTLEADIQFVAVITIGPAIDVVAITGIDRVTAVTAGDCVHFRAAVERRRCQSRLREEVTVKEIVAGATVDRVRTRAANYRITTISPNRMSLPPSPEIVSLPARPLSVSFPGSR